MRPHSVAVALLPLFLLAAACTDSSGTAPSEPRCPPASACGGTNIGGATMATDATGGGIAIGGALAAATGGALGGGGSGTAGGASGTARGGSGTAGGGSSGVAGSAGSPSDCAEFRAPDDCDIPEGAVLPADLRCTGLYGDWEARTLACGVHAYVPAFELWSDGAEKERYMALPAGARIDMSDPDDFIYPVGTRFWKTFYVGPEGQQHLGETRFLRKDELGWVYTTYIWNEDGTEAIQHNEGLENLHGTGHGVPSREQCKACHSGRIDFVLGWDLLMLGPGASGITREWLLENDLIDGLPMGLDLSSAAIPGDEVEKAALGYLHANCGVSCHNETVNATGRPSGLFLRLEVGELTSPLDSDAVSSGVNRAPSPNAELTGLEIPDGGYYDFMPLDPERSLSVVRMRVRGSETAMPALGTHLVDEEGVAIVSAWIEQMTEDRGYPAPAP